MADNDYKSQVLGATDIIALISRSVALKKRGKDFVGLCPFHSEKTPSFHVSPAKQYFYCYGCKAGGDAISFVMKRDRTEFLDALRALGEAAGIPMPRSSGDSPSADQRRALLEANSAAAAFFTAALASAQGAPARAYLEKRGFTPDSIRRFQIGLALDSWDALLKGPVGKKFPRPVLVKAGLARERLDDNGQLTGCYDTFRHRIMFPIRDEVGRIIAFGGRVMPGSDDPAKYLNTPETPLFSKGRCVFALDMARQRVVETRSVVVVEGYTDVVMAHQFGLSNVVSVLGTAMTEQHLGMLRRFADRVVLLFDADAAGSTAVDHAVELYLTQPVEMAVATLPPGVDPDELLIKQGAPALEKVLADATDVLTYKWKQLAAQYAALMNNPTGRHQAVEQYLAPLAKARATGAVDPLRWGQILAQVSRLTGMLIDELNLRFRIGRNQAHRGRKPIPSPGTPGEGQGGGPQSQIANRKSQMSTPSTLDRAEREILGALLAAPRNWDQVQSRLRPADFSDPRRRLLAEALWQHQRDHAQTVFKEFLGALSDPLLIELAVELLEETETRDAGVNDDALVQALTQVLAYVAQEQLTQESQKQLADLPRADDKASSFAAFVKNNQATNLRRLGPVRRSAV